MGFSNRQEGNYITILGGRFCIRATKDTPGAIMRVNKMGKTVYEIFHDSFTGKLIGIKTLDGEYGKSWIFSFKDNEEVYNLQLSYSNSFATAFLKMLPNVDLTKEMKVSPSMKEVDGKTKSSLFINQNGISLKHAYTRENPNGLPQMEQVTVKGQQVWDDTKQIAFLHNMVMTTIIPKLEGAQTASVTPKEAPLSASEQADKDFDSIGQPQPINPDDIPF